ncbi:MAG: dTDP-4-dehydrorhamnose 3,5-epimerase family protein [Planctomycetes bacterium]|nr:dTDP-4-dehydrorhamnose 3,5-epimerase family protein [Planctomycetota bacterium]
MSVEFIETRLPEVKLVKTRVFSDDRGFFTEAYSKDNWAEAGFTETFVQDNISQSSKGTLRGMHYQIAPHDMGKFVRVLRGAIFDVAVLLLVVVPIVIPSVVALDINLVHFGVVIVVNIMLGLVTPPYGMLLFVINTLTGASLGAMIKEIWIFIFVLVLALALMVVFPQIVLWLPSQFGFVY